MKLSERSVAAALADANIVHVVQGTGSFKATILALANYVITKLAPIAVSGSGADLVAQSVSTAKIADAAITPAQNKTKTAVALADVAATLTAAQMVDSGIFTITPTVARILTTDTAANIVAALPRYQVGTWFDISIVNNAAFDVTLAAGVGVTLSGKTIVNDASGTWRARVDSATAITIYNIAVSKGGGGGANTALSNLASVAINLPLTTGAGIAAALTASPFAVAAASQAGPASSLTGGAATAGNATAGAAAGGAVNITGGAAARLTSGDANGGDVTIAGGAGIGTGAAGRALVNSRAIVTSQAAADIALTVKGAVSQTGDLQQWVSSADAVLAKVTATGGIGAVGTSFIGDGAQGQLNIRGNPVDNGHHGISYQNAIDATSFYGYNDRKWTLGNRQFDGTYINAFIYDNGVGLKTWTHAEAINYVFGTATGTKLGTAVTQKLGFWAAVPVVQPAAAAQAAVAGTAGAAYTATEQTLINDLKALVNQLRADLVTVGLIKGAV